MIDCRITIGQGAVSVGIVKTKEQEPTYGLTFRELESPEEIGTSVLGKSTKNKITVLIQNKESFKVLKESVAILERLMNGEDVDSLKNEIGENILKKDIVVEY